MVVFFCDNCGHRMFRTTAGAQVIPPAFRMIWYGVAVEQIYDFCSEDCRRKGVEKLAAMGWLPADTYAEADGGGF